MAWERVVRKGHREADGTKGFVEGKIRQVSKLRMIVRKNQAELEKCVPRGS